MGGISIRIGIGLDTFSPKTGGGGSSEFPSYLSCFANGIWEEEGIWKHNDTWSFQNKMMPFLGTGIWNNEGTFSFGDRIKVQEVVQAQKIDRKYWNF